MSRVLVVDDAAEIRLFVREVLEHAGHDVVEASDAKGALESVEREHPDAMLLDITLPDMEGLAVLRRVRARLSSLPIIMLSGHDTDPTKDEAFSAGCSAFVTKPVRGDDLLNTLNDAIARA